MPLTDTADIIAHVCHEANRAYCAAIGDTSQPDWEHAPAWQTESAFNGVKFHLDTLQNGGKPDPRQSHMNWLRQKEAEGWVYGPVKDPEKKQHPCMVLYENLPIEQRMKDYIFTSIVEAFWTCDRQSEKVPHV